jgi:periplasmic protein TonB
MSGPHLLKSSPWSRIAPLLLAVVATTALLLLMQHLIRTERVELLEPVPAGSITFSRVLADRPLPPRDDAPVKPPVPVPPPPPLMTDHQLATGTDVAFAPPEPPTGSDWRPGRNRSDSELVRLFSVAPSYPERAAARELEGYVVVSFTVTASGTVSDVEVIDANPPGVFERAAIDAALRSRYQPRVVEGRAVTVSGVMQRITFELAQR